MFGTLVVCAAVDAQRRRGLEVAHDGDTVRFASGEGTLTEAGWCAFYADCEHEIRTVESGHRVALGVQPVAGRRGARSGAAVAEGRGGEPADVRRALDRGQRTTAAPTKLCQFLDHSYTETSIQGGWHALKGEDAALAEALHELRGLRRLPCTVETARSTATPGPEVHDLQHDLRRWVPHEDAAVPDAVKKLCRRFRRGRVHGRELLPRHRPVRGGRRLPDGQRGLPL